MKEHPIIFSGPMVKAILEGRKTMTRRPIKSIGRDSSWNKQFDWEIKNYPPEERHSIIAWVKSCPYGQPGDHLWVKETWWQPPFVTERMKHEGADTWPDVIYNADNQDFEQLREWGWKKRPSIFMPKSASRITLEITNIRVERLQEITEEDAKREGVMMPDDDPEPPDFWSYKQEFNWLWNRIYNSDSWNQNPWVWAIEFKKSK